MITENINIDNLSAGENIDVILSFLIDQNKIWSKKIFDRRKILK